MSIENTQLAISMLDNVTDNDACGFIDAHTLHKTTLSYWAILPLTGLSLITSVTLQDQSCEN